MNPHAFFEAHLGVIERAIRRVCFNVGLSGPDADDFASSAKLALLANDGAILRNHQGRSSMSTYLTIVVRRMWCDQQRKEGRWSLSAEARRRGEPAMLLDRLLHRDGCDFAEAAAIVLAQYPETSVSELQAAAAALPERAPRPRLVPLDDTPGDRLAGGDSAEARVEAHENERSSAAISAAVSRVVAALPPEDRVVLRLRYVKDASIADIARALGVEQRPLYRRVEALLRDLRSAVVAAGIDPGTAMAVIGGADEPLDFGLRDDKGEAR